MHSHRHSTYGFRYWRLRRHLCIVSHAFRPAHHRQRVLKRGLPVRIYLRITYRHYSHFPPFIGTDCTFSSCRLTTWRLTAFLSFFFVFLMFACRTTRAFISVIYRHLILCGVLHSFSIFWDARTTGISVRRAPPYRRLPQFVNRYIFRLGHCLSPCTLLKSYPFCRCCQDVWVYAVRRVPFKLTI